MNAPVHIEMVSRTPLPVIRKDEKQGRIVEVRGIERVDATPRGAPRNRFTFDRHFRFDERALIQLDSLESVFFEQELKHIIPEIFRVEHARINARDIFPLDRSAGAVAETIEWRQFEHFGKSKIGSDYGEDIEAVNVKGEPFSQPVRPIITKAMWSIQEIRASRALGRPLDQEQGIAAREVALRRENSIAFDGDSNYGLNGLIDDSDIPLEAPTGGTWLVETAANVLTDLNALSNNIVTGSGDVEIPDTMIMPTTRFNRLATLNAGVGNDTTVLQHFLANNPYIKTVMNVRELEATPKAFAYRRAPNKIRLNIPLDLEQFAPQMRDTRTEVIYHMRTGGVTIHKPLSLRRMNGV